ncbi:ribonuclease H-like domain-containing protein [Podospora appendiculata]|uniref:Ribonuclease H-like domain-containing protein n=1 Tax=Podospora appendiculata TaxID=314037 RepID=A0AAE1CFR0_9PEZI|nr:ribonuclease H-like domain-containing protein [Podospora appendiculata]
MSGISLKPDAKERKTRLEDLYQEAKRVAQTFHIVQFGLTCLCYDENFKVYKTQTYNFNLMPMFIGTEYEDKQLSDIIDRTVSFSYSTLVFSKKHGFSLSKAFLDGDRHLSRLEARDARKEYLEYLQAPPRKFTQELDAFSTEKRSSLKDFFSQQQRKPLLLQVRQPGKEYDQSTSDKVQLVKSLAAVELKDCRVWRYQDHVAIQQLDSMSREWQERSGRKLDENIKASSKQSAFRFIIEALVRNDFAEDITPQLLKGNKTAPQFGDQPGAAWNYLKSLEQKIKKSRPIIIGHNQFYDLCFIYERFIGSLPPDITGFRKELRRLFPRLVDTKHLAYSQHSRGDDGRRPLDELFKVRKDRQIPIFVQDTSQHSEAHQAGYDSWMTAVVFGRIALSMVGDDPEMAALDEDVYAERQPSIIFWLEKKRKKWSKEEADLKMQEKIRKWKENETIIHPDDTTNFPALGTPRANNSTNLTLGKPTATATASAEPPPVYKPLQDFKPGPKGATSVLNPFHLGNIAWSKITRRGTKHEKKPAPTGPMLLELARKKKEEEAKCGPSRIPEWDTALWKKYGNILRMKYGKVLHLDPKPVRRAERGVEKHGGVCLMRQRTVAVW